VPDNFVIGKEKKDMQETYKANGKAIISLILSVLSVICCCLWYISLIIGTAAVILGILGLRSENPNQKDAAIAGIVVGAVGFALAVAAGIMQIVILSGVAAAGTTAALGAGCLI